MERRRLPVGIQTFRQIREQGYYYVDKTAYARRVADAAAGKHYFLSRPRRFGKSLFLDTIKELYEGAEELFRGLAVHGAWDWSKPHPVVRLDFAAGNYRRPGELLARAAEQLEDIERETGAPVSESATAPGRFARLLAALHRREGRRVVVLIDEYDKPILDALDEPALARANRDDLRGLYGTLKTCDAHVELTLITGVSKFSKTSLFAGLNQLVDLTLDPRFAAVCGYTDADLDAVFAPELPGLDRDRIRAWYNGYDWLGGDRVYNPFALLRLFDSRRFKAHWFETGTPRFLIDTLLRRNFPAPDLEGVHADDELLSAFDIDAVATEALLFQTGYLTIVDEEEDADGLPSYRLGYPNREVRRSLNGSLLDALAPRWRSAGNGSALRRVLAAEDWTGLEALFRKLLAGIPHDWHRRNEIARYEGYWSSVFYAFFQASVDGVAVEDATSRGRLDLALKLDGNAYLFEFKVTERSGGRRRPRPENAGGAPPRTDAGLEVEVDGRPHPDRGAPPQADAGAGGDPAAGRPGRRRDPSEETAALAQLKARRYADKYRAPDCRVHLIGVEISAEERDIASFEVEVA